MRKSLPLFACVAFTLAACGKEPAQQTPEPESFSHTVKVNRNPLPAAVDVDLPVPDGPFGSVAEPDFNVSESWMVIEGGVGKFGPVLGYPGADKLDSHYLWKFDRDLASYAKMHDDGAGLPGPGGPVSGMSRNPLVYQSPPHLTARAFNLFYHHLATLEFSEFVFVMPLADGTQLQLRHSIRPREVADIAEPPPPIQPPERPVEFPKDDPENAQPTDDPGIRPPPPIQPPERPVDYPRDEPIAEDPTEDVRIIERVTPRKPVKPEPRPLDRIPSWEKRTIDVIPMFDKNKEIFGFRTLWAERLTKHEDTAFRLNDLCDADGNLDLARYRKLRTALAEAILARVPEDGSVFEVRIHLTGDSADKAHPPADLSVDWLVVFLQIDALRVVNESGKSPVRQLATEFEYMQR